MQHPILLIALDSRLLAFKRLLRQRLKTHFLILHSDIIISHRFYRAACNATHGIALAIPSVCSSVCLSVRPSVC